MKKILCGLFFFAGIFFKTALAKEQNIPQAIQQAQKNIIKIDIGTRTGSAFFISPDTLVTNFHVLVHKGKLPPVKKIKLRKGVKFYDRVKVKGIKALSPIDDLALLEVENYQGETLKFSDQNRESKEVYFLGFINGRATTIKGLIEGQDDRNYRVRILSGMPYQKMIIPLYSGMSGGPMLDSKGNLIGVNGRGFITVFPSLGKNLRVLLEQSSAVSSNGEELLHIKIEEMNFLAEQGDPYVQHVLGQYHMLGVLPENYKLAYKWIKSSAEQGGDPFAPFSLLFLYANNKSKQERDLFTDEEFHRWLKSSAEQGLLEAQLFLGIYYYKIKDYKLSYDWIKRVAEQGLPQAELFLGFMYQRGKAIPRDYSLAYDWVKKSKEQGVPLAKHYLRFISFMENINSLPVKAKKTCLGVFNGS